VLEVNGEACALGVFADITDRREAEEALREAKDFSENLIRTANVIILGLDSEATSPFSIRLRRRLPVTASKI